MSTIEKMRGDFSDERLPIAPRFLTNRIDEIRGAIMFLAIGGSIALVNLVFVRLLSHQHMLPYVVYVSMATELSVCMSFLLNDRITFRRLTATGRAWYRRCFRFHCAAGVGALVTVGISTAAYYLLRFPPVAAQAAAIVIATGVNFSMHRLWTYGRPRTIIPR
jgi:putative flippase GtrA